MANFSAMAQKTLQLMLLYLRNILTNLYRRLLILGKHVGIYWQKHRLGNQFRKLGDEIYTKYTAGDVNPLLQEEVKDLLTAIQAQVDNIDGRRQAIQEIREQIRSTSYRLAAAPAAAEPEAGSDEP